MEAGQSAKVRCITDLDRGFILPLVLKPIFLGDLVHVSASVNRAWGSSMEVGVRIVKETAENGANSPALEYVSHCTYRLSLLLAPTAVQH